MYIKTEAPLVQASWLKITSPVLTEAFVIIQDIGFQRNEEFNLVQNLNFGFQITAWFLSLSFFSFIFIGFLVSIRKLTAKNMLLTKAFNLKKAITNYMSLSKRFSFTLSSMSIFLVMFNLYLWLFMVLITNATQTNKIVIDTSEIIQDADDALNTKRTFCLIEDDTEFKVS